MKNLETSIATGLIILLGGMALLWSSAKARDEAHVIRLQDGRKVEIAPSGWAERMPPEVLEEIRAAGKLAD